MHSATLPEKHGTVVICVAFGCVQSVSSVSVPGESGLPGMQRVETNCVADGVEHSVSTDCAVIVAGFAFGFPHPELTYCGGLSQAPVVRSTAASHIVHESVRTV